MKSRRPPNLDRTVLRRTRFPRRASTLLATLTCLALGLLSCVANHKSIALYFPPRTAPLASSLPMARVTQVREEERPILRVLEFEDVREWSRVGENRTRIGFHTGVIEASSSIESWFRRGISNQLSTSGYTVIENASIGDPLQATFTLEGKIRKLFAAHRFFHEADLAFSCIVRCTCHRKIVLSCEYAFSSSLDRHMEDGHAEVLSRALLRAGTEIALDLSPALRSDCHRYLAPDAPDDRDVPDAPTETAQGEAP